MSEFIGGQCQADRRDVGPESVKVDSTYQLHWQTYCRPCKAIMQNLQLYTLVSAKTLKTKKTRNPGVTMVTKLPMPEDQQM